MGLDDKLVRKKLEVLLKDENLVNAYIRTYGAKLDMRNIEALKEKQKSSQSAVPMSASDDPTYQLKVKCPVCFKPEIICHEVKSKALTITYDKFMTPRYQPAKGFQPLNYSLLAVTVCPMCLFSSPDKKDFITLSVQTKTENKSQLTPYVLDKLKEKEPDRRKMLGEGADAAIFLTVPRSIPAAVSSYRLALHRALIEASFETPLAWYKAGMYCLKMGMFLRDQSRPDDTCLQEAAKFLAKSYQASELPTPELEYQLLYTVVAINLRLGNEAQCQSYLGTFEKLKAEQLELAKTDPEIKIAVLEKWQDQAKDLWTDREDPDLWLH